MHASQEIVRKINERLAEIGMSKTEFYERSGISSASLSQWNTGKSYPSFKKLMQIAECLNITFDELTGTVIVIREPIEKLENPQDDYSNLRDDQKDIIELIKSLDSRQCREILNILYAAMRMAEEK